MDEEKPPYVVEERQIIAETDDLSVSVFVLAEEQEVPWHHHSNITDRFFCLEGELSVATRSAAGDHLLGIGETCAVPAGVPHRVRGRDGSRCRFLIVQGIGAYDYCPD